MPSNQLLSSKIVFSETAPSGRAAPSFNTAVMAFEGVTEKGPVGVATQCKSFADFVRIFGSYVADGYLATCVEGFFISGGSVCYVTRVVHYTTITDATSKTSVAATAMLTTGALAATAAQNTSVNAGPYASAPGQTVLTVVDSNGAVTATVTATKAALTAANAGPIVLANNGTLTVKVDGGAVQTVTFVTGAFANITAATSAEIAAAISAGLVGASVDLNGGKVRITSDKAGTGSSVEVTGGSSNTNIGFSTTPVIGTGNVVNAAAVTATEIRGLIATAVGATAAVSVVGGAIKIVSATAGTSSHVQVTSASTMTALGFDNAVHNGTAGATLNTLAVAGKYDGAYGNALTVQRAAASSGAADRFNLYVLDPTARRLESWVNLSMTPGSAQYVETVINAAKGGSTLISVDDQGVGTVPAVGSVTLTGGNNGLVGIADTDFVGSQASWTGLYSFDRVSSITVLAIPGIATPAVHLGMLGYCETHRQGMIMAILDPPANNDAEEITTYVSTTAAIENLSEFGAIYWPLILVANPNMAVYGSAPTIVIPPSGDVCGVIARTDNSRSGGVWIQPAGTETGKLTRVLGFETDDVLSEDVRDLVFPHRINPLTTQEGFPRYIDGARTLKGNGNFPSLGQRRGVSFSERSIKAALEPMRHQNNNVGTRAICQRTVKGFLKTQCDLGAFATTIPDQAFYVDFGDALQTQPNVIDGAWGVATTQPAEFIRMTVSQDTRASDAAANG